MLFANEYKDELDCFVNYNNKVKKYLDIRNPKNIDKLDQRVKTIQEKFSNLDTYNIRRIYPNTNDFPEIIENRNYIFDYYDDNRKELHYYKNIKGVDSKEWQ